MFRYVYIVGSGIVQNGLFTVFHNKISLLDVTRIKLLKVRSLDIIGCYTPLL